MRMKLLIAIGDDNSTEELIETARAAGASGATVIERARDAKHERFTSLMGLDLAACQDVVLFVVPAGKAACVIDRLARAAASDATRRPGVLCQLDIEDSVGLRQQVLEQTPPSDAERH